MGENIGLLVHPSPMDSVEPHAMGPSAPRRPLFLRSICGGVEGAVQQLTDDTTASNQNIGSFARSSVEVRLLLASCAVGLAPIEALILELMNDDRLLIRRGELEAMVVRVMTETAHLPALVWARLALTVRVSAADVQDECLYVMMIAYGITNREVFAELYEYPLRMTQGSITANIEALRATPIEDLYDTMTQRMKNLITMGREGELEEALELWKETATTSKVVEEGHASGAVMLREHELLTEKGLRVAALMHSMRSIVRRKKISGVRRRIQTQLRKLEKRRPKKAGAKQLFLKTYARMRQDGVRDKHIRWARRKAAWADHSDLFRDAPLPVKLRLHRKSRVRAAAKIEQIKAAKELLQAEERAAELMEAAEESRSGLSNHICSGRLTDEEINRASDLFLSEEYQVLKMEAHIGAFGNTPPVGTTRQPRVSCIFSFFIGKITTRKENHPRPLIRETVAS